MHDHHPVLTTAGLRLATLQGFGKLKVKAYNVLRRRFGEDSLKTADSLVLPGQAGSRKETRKLDAHPNRACLGFKLGKYG